MSSQPEPPPISEEPDSPSGDKIDVKNQGERSAIAAGRRAWAWVLNIDIREVKWQPVVIVLTIVGTLLGLILWFVIPKTSSVMTGQFNVAVAELLVQDAHGKRVGGQDGKLLGEYVRQQIDTQFNDIELRKTVPYEIWGPGQTGVIKGKTPQERSVAAEALARRIHASVVVYGVIISDGNKSRFLPEFYINHASFSDASEITGDHEIGSQLRVVLPFGNSIQAIENPALAGRVNALDLVTIGLAYYSIDDFENALSYFEKAAKEERWVGGGKEVVYLLIGNAYVRQASKIQEFTDLPLADQNYQMALDNNRNYGRAMIGEANVLYLTASVDKKCDSSGLDQASDLLDRTLALQGQPSSANIETKVHLYRGQIAIIRDSCHLAGDDWLKDADNEFTWVAKQYETRKEKDQDFEGIKSLASPAYAGLGYIAYQRGQPQPAIGWLQKAVEIASPYYQGVYTSLIGDIYAVTGQKEQAIQAYEDARAIAEANGDGIRAKKYKEKLQAIQSQ